MAYLPNRIVIGAIDNALNRVDDAIRHENQKKKPSVELVRTLDDEHLALRVARTFIAEKRA